MTSKPAPAFRGLICEQCGWTSYPRPAPAAERPGLTEWRTPEACERCGHELERG